MCRGEWRPYSLVELDMRDRGRVIEDEQERIEIPRKILL